jgi:hypothetical protein
MEVRTMRALGYFYSGFEAQFWWWELGIKRLDVFAVYLATYLPIVSDPKGKLILFTAIAAICWALHSMRRPYDTRSNSLIDRVEEWGLRTRFLTLVVLQVVLLLDGSSLLCSFAAVYLILATGIFLLTLVVLYVGETGAFEPQRDTNQDDQLAEQQDEMHSRMSRATTRAGSRAIMSGDEDDDPNVFKKLIQSLFRCFMATFGRCLVTFVRDILMKPFLYLGERKALLQERVPHIVWHGVGVPIQIVEHKTGVALQNVRNKKFLTDAPQKSTDEMSDFRSSSGTFSNALVRSSSTFSKMLTRSGSLGSMDSTAVPNRNVEKAISHVSGIPSEAIFEIEERDNSGTILSHRHARNIDQILRSDNGTTLYEIDGQVYSPMKVGRHWDANAIVDRWLKRLYKLKSLDQRRYIAHSLSQMLQFMAAESNMGAIPAKFYDFTCLLSLTLQRAKGAGMHIDLTKNVDQEHILSEMQKLAMQKHQEDIHSRKATVKVVGQPGRFAHKPNSIAHAFKPDYMLSPDELMRTVVSLRRLPPRQLHRFLSRGLKMLVARQLPQKEEVLLTDALDAFGSIDDVTVCHGCFPRIDCTQQQQQQQPPPPGKQPQPGKRQGSLGNTHDIDSYLDSLCFVQKKEATETVEQPLIREHSL